MALLMATHSDVVAWPPVAAGVRVTGMPAGRRTRRGRSPAWGRRVPLGRSHTLARLAATLAPPLSTPGYLTLRVCDPHLLSVRPGGGGRREGEQGGCGLHRPARAGRVQRGHRAAEHPAAVQLPRGCAGPQRPAARACSCSHVPTSAAAAARGGSSCCGFPVQRARVPHPRGWPRPPPASAGVR